MVRPIGRTADWNGLQAGPKGEGQDAPSKPAVSALLNRWPRRTVDWNGLQVGPQGEGQDAPGKPAVSVFTQRVAMQDG